MHLTHIEEELDRNFKQDHASTRLSAAVSDAATELCVAIGTKSRLEIERALDSVLKQAHAVATEFELTAQPRRLLSYTEYDKARAEIERLRQRLEAAKAWFDENKRGHPHGGAIAEAITAFNSLSVEDFRFAFCPKAI